MILVFVAYGWFAYFCLIAYIDYQKEITGLNQFLTPVNELPLPAITVCSKEIFKNVSEETTADMILQTMPKHFFTREDLFHESFVVEKWNPHEIFSSPLGICTSITAWMNATSGSFSPFWISLQAGKKYKVGLLFISNPYNCLLIFIRSKSLLSFLRFFYMNLVLNTGFNTTLSHQSEMCCTLIPIQTMAFMESREH